MEKLGIQPIQLLAQIFNFLVLMILLKKYLYKPILKVLDERKKKIEEGLAASQQAKKELGEAENKKAEIIAKAKVEATKLIEEAKKSGKRLEGELREEAEKEATEIIKKGKKELEGEQRQMEKQMEKDAVEIATALVEKLLKQALNDSSQQLILERKLKEIAKLTK